MLSQLQVDVPPRAQRVSVTVAKDKGPTMVVVNADGNNLSRPLCKISAVLGTIQTVGSLFSIANGTARLFYPEDIADLGGRWPGAVYITIGVMSILARQFPSRSLLGFTMFMSILATLFAIISTVLCSIELHSYTCLVWLSCKYYYEILQVIMLLVLAVLQLCVCVSFVALGIKALVRKKKEEEEEEEEVGGDVEDQQPEMERPS